MKYEVLKVGKKRFYMDINDKHKCRIVDSNSGILTPYVDFIEVKDDLFHIHDYIYISADPLLTTDGIRLTIHFYVNTEGIPVSPCFVNYYPDTMYTLPAKNHTEFLEYYPTFKVQIMEEITGMIESKIIRTEQTCLELAKLGKKRKNKWSN